MEIDAEKFKALAIETFKKFRELETELLKYRMVFLAHGQKLDITDMLEQLLEVASKNPELERQMREKYDPPMEKIRQHVDESKVDEDLARWLRDWKPQGPIN